MTQATANLLNLLSIGAGFLAAVLALIRNTRQPPPETWKGQTPVEVRFKRDQRLAAIGVFFCAVLTIVLQIAVQFTPRLPS